MTAIDLKGATVVVTGASRGFGRATAVALAESGAQVVQQTPIAVAPGYVLEVLDSRCSRTRNGVGRPDLLWGRKTEVTMRSARNNLREVEDSVLALSANTEVHRWPHLAVLAVSCFTAIARRSGARALLEPRGGLVGWRCVVFTPEAGVVVYWKPKR
jgi:hypothetical protein